MVVLGGTCMIAGSGGRAEGFAVDLEHGLIDLAVKFDHVNGDTKLVGELGGAHGSFVPSHDGTAVCKELGKH